MAHNATLVAEGKTYHFASMDGELWLGVNQPVTTPEGEAWLATVMTKGIERDGQWFLPIKCTTEWLTQSVAHLYEGGVIEFH